ncbi:MAG: hypothetical protein EBZ67_10050 [Chitinophagia bacterium]|nr:hypothetical protein [Chitinophagia bacterium]
MYRFDMERAEILSEILRDQIRSGAPRESLLWTLGMIRTEILAMPASAGSQASAIPEKPAHEVGADSEGKMLKPEGPRLIAPLSDPDMTIPSEPSRAPSSRPSNQAETAAVPAESPAGRLIHHESPLEINQRVADGGASLNDRLRQGAPELSERLMPEAVTDLRNAFGINDRFRLINELFRGDGTAFDEAVHRLNGMPGLSEALSHIDHELSVRWGWDTVEPMVDQLRQSVRRRFSAI